MTWKTVAPTTGPPQRALAAEQHHEDHEDAERDRREGHLARLDEARHVAEDGAGDAEEERRNHPGDALVGLRLETHAVRLVLVVADRIDRQPEPRPIQPSHGREGGDRQREVHRVEGVLGDSPDRPGTSAARCRRHRRPSPTR